MPNVSCCLHLVLIAWLGVAVAAEEPDPDPKSADKAVREEMARLKGAWFPTESTAEGRKADDLGKIRLTVDEDRWILSFADGVPLASPRFTVRPDKKPKELDVISIKNKGKIILRAIYELEGDTLRLCFAVGDADRPRRFISEPGSKTGITIYERKLKIPLPRNSSGPAPAIAEKGGPQPVVRIHEPETLHSLALAPDGKLLAAGDLHGNLLLLDASTGKLVANWKGHDDTIMSLAFRPDGKLLASGDSEGTVHLWDVATRARRKSLPQADAEGIVAVTFSPDGKTLATGGWDEKIRIWDAATGEKLQELAGHEFVIDTLAFSPDGTLLASAGWDVTVRLWDLKTGRCLHTMTGHQNTEHSSVGINLVQGVVFSPDGKTLYSAATHIKIWDVATGAEKATIEDKTRYHIYTLDISPDGKILATGKYEGDVSLWDISQRERIVKLKAHNRQIDNLRFSPDGKALISGAVFEGIKIWKLPIADPEK